MAGRNGLPASKALKKPRTSVTRFYMLSKPRSVSTSRDRREWLTFVIVGAGATGVELAGAIAEIARQTLKDDFRSIHPEEAQILLLDGAPRVLGPFPETLSEKAQRSLERLGVHVRTGVMVKSVDREGLTLECGDSLERLPSRTVIWAGGVTAASLGGILAERTHAKTDRGGRIEVGPDLTVAGYPEIYVIGDLALYRDRDAKPLPGVAQVAMQQGTYAAKSIIKKIRGESCPQRFEYFDKGSLAVIGRAAAVADIFGLHLSGLSAWLVWVFIHLMYIVEFQSRLLVFVRWAFECLTFSRGARLITGSAATDFDPNRDLAGGEIRSRGVSDELSTKAS